MQSAIFKSWSEKFDRLVRKFEPYEEDPLRLVNMRMTNRLSLMVMPVCLPFAVLYLWWGLNFEALFVFFTITLFSLPLYLNLRGRLEAARLAFALASNGCLFLLSGFFGRESGIQWCFFSTACLFHVVYSGHESAPRTFSISIPMFCYAVLEWIDYDFGIQADIGLAQQLLISKAIIPTVFLLTAMALSQRTRANEEILHKIEKTSGILRQMGKAIDEVFWIRSGNDLSFSFVSHGCEKVWGVGFSELIRDQRELQYRLHPDDVKMFSSTWTVGQVSPEKFELKYRIIRDGQVRWVWSRCFPQVDAQGRLLQVYGVTSDITDSKRAQKLIEQQRSRMVNSARLAALGEMASGIAHEVNNPLTIIHSKADVIRMMLDQPPEKMDLEKLKSGAELIQKTAMRIAKIVKALRLFARDGENDAFAPTSLKAIVDDTLELCQEKIKYAEIKLLVDAVPAHWSLECRSAQIGQVLLNLLMNSVDAVSKQDEKWIRVEVQETTDSLTVRVTDSGPGIPKGIRQKIMQPFFTTKEVGKGTGLGLSISKGIIESHHGSLKLDETQTQTSFVVTLPKVQASSGQQELLRNAA